MPKQKIEIEVEVPEGWEFVRFGLPKAGEEYINGQGGVNKADCDYWERLCVIVQPVWQWPEWLKSSFGWIAMDKDGNWYAYRSEPFAGDYSWLDGQALLHLSHEALDFTPPPCTDWRQSKRRRPVL